MMDVCFPSCWPLSPEDPHLWDQHQSAHNSHHLCGVNSIMVKVPVPSFCLAVVRNEDSLV